MPTRTRRRDGRRLAPGRGEETEERPRVQKLLVRPEFLKDPVPVPLSDRQPVRSGDRQRRRFRFGRPQKPNEDYH
jgi:hypothetical protein